MGMLLTRDHSLYNKEVLNSLEGSIFVSSVVSVHLIILLKV